MKRTGALLTITTALAFTAPASAHTQTITLVNAAHIAAPEIRHVEHALSLQARQLRHYWHTPLIRFGPHGWRVFYQHYSSSIPGIEGNHYTGHSALITSYGETSDDQWTVALSHELVEMLVDPSTRGIEVCDPVADQSYTLAGVQVADFITPTWLGGAGPWDKAGALSLARQITPGGYIWAP